MVEALNNRVYYEGKAWLFCVNTLGFSDVCQEVNQDLRVKRVRKNLGLGVKMSTMYERIDRGV